MAKRSAAAGSTQDHEQIDAITAELYAVDLDAFMAKRTATVKRLRSEGDRELATAVGKVRKPTLAAWAVNAAARANASAVDELIELGGRLRDAQDALLAGESRAELRSALDERRVVVRRLADAAVAEITSTGGNGEGARDEIVATFEAASLDADVADQLRTGRLAKTTRGPVGFEMFGFGSAPPDPTDEKADSTTEKPARSEKPAHSEKSARSNKSASPSDTAAAEKRQRAARERAAEARARAEEAQQEADRKRAELEQLEEAIDALEQQLEQARQAADSARADLAAAEDAAESARRAVAD